jgi:hypothetical protein
MCFCPLYLLSQGIDLQERYATKAIQNSNCYFPTIGNKNTERKHQLLRWSGSIATICCPEGMHGNISSKNVRLLLGFLFIVTLSSKQPYKNYLYSWCDDHSS